MACPVVSKFSFHIQSPFIFIITAEGSSCPFLLRKGVSKNLWQESFPEKQVTLVRPIPVLALPMALSQVKTPSSQWRHPAPSMGWHQALSYTVVPGKDGSRFIFLSSKTKQQTLPFILLQINFIFLKGRLLNHLDRGTWERPAEQHEHCAFLFLL